MIRSSLGISTEAVDLVTAIVPVYNTPRDLVSRGIESLCEQSHRELEILVIDDGSSPSYAEWLDGFVDRDDRIRVIHQENMGVSAARNLGMKEAKGAYVCFVDSDDWVSSDYISAAVGVAIANNTEAVFGGIRVWGDGFRSHWRSGDSSPENPLLVETDALTPIRVETLSASPALRSDTPLTTITNVVGALFERTLASRVGFQEGIAHAEDRLFICDLLGFVNRAAICSEIWYHYEQSSGSATQSLTYRSAEQLAQTIGAYLQAGGFSDSAKAGSLATEVRAAAGVGVFNYLKLLTGVLAINCNFRDAAPLLNEVLRAPGAIRGIQVASSLSPEDRVFRWFARRRKIFALYVLGRLWTLVSPGAPKRPRKSGIVRNSRNPLELGDPKTEIIGENQREGFCRPRVAVIIHYSTSNYGNHLVNYATLKLLQHVGVQVELIDFFGGVSRLKLGSLLRLPQKLHRLGVGLGLKRFIGRVRRGLAPRATEANASKLTARDYRFQTFAAEHLKPRKVDVKHREKLLTEFDYFAIGSDQIWNYDYGLGPWHFADFVSSEKVITLAPSVGHDEIPREWQGFYKRHLGAFREVGTRELRWTESLTFSDAGPKFTQLIDPTLMISGDEWAQLANPMKDARGKLLVYALGELAPEHQKFIELVCELHGLTPLVLSPYAVNSSWATDAADFLGFVSTAEAVITDSFHGAVFSFLFNKPLTLIHRVGFAGAMNSRIETLAAHFNLRDRFIANVTPSVALTCDYEVGKVALEKLRGEFCDFLARHGLVSTSTEESDR